MINIASPKGSKLAAAADMENRYLALASRADTEAKKIHTGFLRVYRPSFCTLECHCDTFWIWNGFHVAPAVIPWPDSQIFMFLIQKFDILQFKVKIAKKKNIKKLQTLVQICI